MVSDPNGYVPAEAIIGCYIIGDDGVATGEYVHNPRYGKVQDEFERLESTDGLGWLPAAPSEAVRGEVASALSAQVEGARLEWFKVVDDPVFLTGGVRDPDDPTKAVIRRAALAVPFALSVSTPSQRRDVLTGVFTWVATGLDGRGPRRDRTWFDPGMTRSQAAELLEQRIYELDRAS